VSSGPLVLEVSYSLLSFFSHSVCHSFIITCPFD
jgi:hypothetical protein